MINYDDHMNEYIISIFIVYSGNLFIQFFKLDVKIVTLCLLTFCIHSMNE